jgi:prepilin-type processing-associated H-X9-DG protein
MSVIGILAAMVLPAIARAKDRARSPQCLANARQLVQGWTIYSDDHDGRLPPNIDSIDGMGSIRSWVGGHMHWQIDATNPSVLIDPNFSLLAGYITTPRLYKCPGDRSAFVRSYAMNCRMNPVRPFEGAPSWIGGRGKAFATFRRITDVQRPSSVMSILSERSDSINDASFAVDMSNTGMPDGIGSPTPFFMIDFPSGYHLGAGTVSFADGHADLHRWVEPTTTPPIGRVNQRAYPISGDRDVAWLQRHCTYPIKQGRVDE